MIIWNGLGFLVFVIVFGCSFAANLIANNVTNGEQYWNENTWPFGVSLLISSVFCWFLGKKLTQKAEKTLIDKETGEEYIQKPYHALFFIKMHWWGPILFVGGGATIAMDLLK